MVKKVTISGQFNKSINFAMQQNYVPIIRTLVIKNETEEPVKNLKLKITFEPAFAKVFTYGIDTIEAGEAIEISPVRISISTEFLFSLTEKMVGTLIVDLTEEEDKIYEYESTIELLAYDQWSGLMVMPELITAFVTPNHPKVSEILTQAAKYLNQWTKMPAFTDYQTKNPNQVKLQMGAIYAALQDASIVYNNPPASYEEMGQRVRLPHVVLEKRQGTCLDLAVLYAACLEAVGLFSLIVFKKGHAYGGCWLEEQTFADCMVEDSSALEKRIVEGSEELLLVECTDFTLGKKADFEKALKHGKDHLLASEDFIAVIDVNRSRGSGIRPIPIKLEQARSLENNTVDDITFENKEKKAPQALHSMKRADLSETEKKLTKQEMWERKLLDFSLRNALLNFRATKNTLQLMTANLNELEDKLSEGKNLSLLEVPSEWVFSPRDVKMFEIENEKDLIESIATEELKRGRIRTFLPEQELGLHLKYMYRAARESMEENGANTLFLALGFLRWFESGLSEKPRYAPIILIPVELVRSLKNKGYIIRSRQEDAQINITLLEYLRQVFEIKINGLDPLPTDEHGIDLQLIFHTLRQAIMAKPYWNIENMAFIGLFSFGQFVMWNDLRNHSKELETNKVVSSLIEGKMNWAPEDKSVTLSNLDTVIEPEKMAIPMSVDSSQLVAIVAATEGHSFVLHGPPGTGKSQTITNMIANALYQGKSVLFVAEKMAALNVVQNRLASIGLDPFCLELHSNKTNKSVVLGQLNKALEVGRVKAPDSYESVGEKIHTLRNSLNEVMEALHCKRDYGCSLYEAIEIYEGNKREKGNIVFKEDQVQLVNQEVIKNWQEVLRKYTVAIKENGSYAESAWQGYEGTVYSIELREQLEEDLRDIISLRKSSEDSLKLLGKWADIREDWSKGTIDELCKLATVLENTVPTFEQLIRSQSCDSLLEEMKTVCREGSTYKKKYNELSNAFERQVFDYPIDHAIMRWKQAERSWFLPKLLEQGKLLKELRLYAKKSADLSKSNIFTYYEKLAEVGRLKNKLTHLSSELTSLISNVFRGTDTDWNLLENALIKAEALHQIVKNVSKDKYEGFIKAIVQSHSIKEISEKKQVLIEFVNKVEKVTSTYSINVERLGNSHNWVDAIVTSFEKYVDHLPGLKVWTDVREQTSEMRKSKLENVVQAWEKGQVTAENIQRAFEGNLYYALILKTIREDDRLKRFQGKQYEDMIKQYGEVIEEFRRLTIQELVAKLSAQIPITGTVSAASSEISILKKAIKSNGRRLSIRKLFDEIPTLLRKLCPCMLMSPISVAQYIDPKFPKFDLVIFDEASQLPTSEAVGSIARGKNVVIVGDPKQLPPTSFFSSNKIDEENADKEDLESLLDDCLSIAMPQEHLKWHYRSRHESLIAYSNMKYYDNKLYTFPSPNDLVSEVKLIHVEGYYDKGKTKQNKEEARAVVNEILRRLRDEQLKKESIGVVTFSSVQQNLIDDMLTTEFAKYPELEEQDRNSKEPVFIKNLENVQGDERDVILFSIGYGPDKEGKVSMNFGPLNREGGWRRLNVAISRARKSMLVYATLRPEQIDLSRTRAEGLVGLKGFLEFAQRGKNALTAKAEMTMKPIDTLVRELAYAIKALGYKVKCNIGSSAYKMDIGIINENNPDSYLLGILLDGQNCKEAATAKDRFVLQPNVLNGLGWKIMRVWTLEWLDNPDKVLKSIEEEIKITLQEAPIKTKVTNVTPRKQLKFESIELTPAETSLSTLQPYYTKEIEYQGEADAFYRDSSQPAIINMICQVLNMEAPISKKALMRKVLSAWGISRSGSRVEATFDLALKKVVKKETIELDNIFYWKYEQEPQGYMGYRVEDQNGDKRSMEDISIYEIQNAMVEVLSEQVSLSRIDLIRETAKKFGFARIGNVIDITMQNAIDSGICQKLIVIQEGDKVVLI